MENTENISTVITIINLCSERFEFSKLRDNLASISGIGALVRSLSGISSVDGEIIRKENNETHEEPMLLEDVRELERRLRRLFEKSNETVGSLKYDIDNPNIMTVFNASTILFKYMLNTLRTPNTLMFDNLRNEYKKKSPLHHAYNFTASIESDSTNPITYAMSLDRFKTKATFEKWSNFIDAILSQLLFMEAFCCGMFSNEDMYTADLLNNEIEGTNLRIEELKNRYKNDDSYWPHIKNFVHDVQDHNVHLGNISKSEILQNKLETILTNDAFFVLVYDHCEESHRHAFVYPDSQGVTSFNRGNCNVAVYRSRHWNTASEEEKKKIRDEVEGLSNKRFPWSNNYREILEFIDGVAVHKAKLLAIIRKDRNIAIRVINCETGPGAYTTVRAGNDNQNSVYTFFAGFR
ncbi:hypothetical protein CAEBREN_32733 [Caenorhabditis brenneri]|uniref:Uncharacterized protein n=1 Tax=Caenorhabditis brenneri TaxID=135651 RepID=G0NN78_CAEBE|nr:hypothetical protein CAEBREN_32733 [Caenorhabditis brenneri]